MSPSPELMSTLWYPSVAPESVSVGVSKTFSARALAQSWRPATQPCQLPTTSTSFAAVGRLSPLRVHPPLRARSSQGAGLGPNASRPRLSRPAPEPKQRKRNHGNRTRRPKLGAGPGPGGGARGRGGRKPGRAAGAGPLGWNLEQKGLGFPLSPPRDRQKSSIPGEKGVFATPQH